MRHGEAQPDHLAKVDRERALSGVGLKQLDSMCQKMHNKFQGVDFVLCSNAKRTRQTYEGIRRIVPASATVEFEDKLYHAPLRSLLDRIHRIDDRYRHALIIAHNPGLQDFLDHVVQKTAPDMLVKSFQTCSASFFEMQENFWFNLDFSRLLLKEQVLP